MENTLKNAAAPGSARPMSRRRFFKAIGFGVAGGALLAAGGRSLTAALMAWMFPAPLVRSTFAARLGETFQVRADSARVGLQLVKVSDLYSVAPQPAHAQPGRTTEENFSILFRGPSDQSIVQGTYDFAHDRMGGFPLFIVPMASEKDARYYEAIFNRQQA